MFFIHVIRRVVNLNKKSNYSWFIDFLINTNPSHQYESIDSKSFGPALILFTGQKSVCRFCNGLSDLLLAFSFHACGNLIGPRGYFRWLPPLPPLRKTAFPVCARGMHRPPTNHTVFDRIFASLAAAVNPVTTTVITYCFIAGSQLLTHCHSPVYYRIHAVEH